MIDYLPPPQRSILGTMPFNPEQGVDKKERKLSRALKALPLLVICACAMKLMNPEPIEPQLISLYESGKITWDSGSAPIVTSFYGIPFLDKAWAPIVLVFSQWNIGFDIAGSWQMFTFLTDFGLVYSIFLLESNRRANALTLAKL